MKCNKWGWGQFWLT